MNPIRNPQSAIRNWLDRLFPERLRQRKELSATVRLEIWSHVSDQDLCLRAMHDLLDDLLQHNALIAFSPDLPAEKRLLAADRAGIALEIMQTIENEREQAKATK